MISREEIIEGVEVTIIKKRNLKRLYVRIKPPEAKVVVTAPHNYSNIDIRCYLISKMPEIKEMQKKMLLKIRQTERQYITNEIHYLWGMPYKLILIQEGNRYQIIKEEKEIILYTPAKATKEARERVFNEWYRKELQAVLNEMVLICEKRTSLHANEYKIKNMKTRWGTCNISKKRIWINLQLVKKPVECLEYIVIHELVHLIEKNHNRRFYSIVEKYYPTWKGIKKVLNRVE